MLKEIKRLMEIKHCGIEKLSDATGLQYSYVYKVLMGEKVPSKKFLSAAIFFLTTN